MPGKKGQVTEALVLQRVYGARNGEAAFLPYAKLASTEGAIFKVSIEKVVPCPFFLQ